MKKDKNMKKNKNEKRGGCLTIIIAVLIICVAFSVFGADKDKKEDIKNQKQEIEDSQLTIEEKVKDAVIQVVGEENLDTFSYIPENNFALIKFKGSENLSREMTVKGMYIDIYNILKEIQEYIDVNVDFNIIYPLQDVYGNTREDIVIKASYNNDTIKKIDFENFLWENIPSVADEWWNHNAANIS